MLIVVLVTVLVEASTLGVDQHHHLTGLEQQIVPTGLTMVKVIMVIPTEYLADLGHTLMADLADLAEAQVVLAVLAVLVA